MKISELVQELLNVMKESGDLEVFDEESFLVQGVDSEFPCKAAIAEYDLPPVIARIITHR